MVTVQCLSGGRTLLSLEVWLVGITTCLITKAGMWPEIMNTPLLISSPCKQNKTKTPLTLKKKSCSPVFLHGQEKSKIVMFMLRFASRCHSISSPGLGQGLRLRLDESNTKRHSNTSMYTINE